MYSDISRRINASSSPNIVSAKVRANSVLPTPVSPGNRKERSGVSDPCSPARERRIAFAGGDRIVLTDDPLMQFFFQVEQMHGFVFLHLFQRNARPTRHHFLDIRLVHDKGYLHRPCPKNFAVFPILPAPAVSSSRFSVAAFVFLRRNRRFLFFQDARQLQFQILQIRRCGRRGNAYLGRRASSMTSIALSGRKRSAM